jgi:iron(III) transport system permease protein
MSAVSAGRPLLSAARAPRGRRALRIAAVAVALLLAWLVGYPLLLTLIDALRGPAGWTATPFAQFLARPDEWMALWRSVWISLASVALAALLGVPLAFLMERADFPGRRMLAAIAALPVALPPLVGVIAFLFLYGESGFVPRALMALLGLHQPPWRLAGPGAILLVHAYSMYVYFYLFARAALARMDGALLEAAASLGAGSRRQLVRITLPLLKPALAGAALLTFMTALASFSAPYVFGGGFRVMTTQIVASKLNGDLAMARVETVALTAVALLALWAMRGSGETSVVSGSVRGVAPARRRIESRGGRAATAAAAYVLATVLLLPHAVLILLSFVPAFTWTVEALPPVLDLGNYRSLVAEAEHLRPVVNSLWMASAAAAAALAVGFAAARLSLLARGRLGRALEALIAFPWAIPGTVFAIALATTWSVHQPWLGRFVLIGTPVILPLAYFIRDLPLTGRAALSGLAQLDPALDEAAASLGAGRARRLLRVTMPLVWPALAAGVGLAFITALGDLVTSIVLYTYDTRPIAIEILASLRLQDLGMAAVYGVLLMTASAAAFMLWGRESRG